MRNLPQANYAYSGLTIIMSAGSRFDRDHLWSGHAGQYAEQCLLAGGNKAIHRATVEIRTISESAPLLEGTKLILLMGQDALRYYKPDVTLDEQRGSPFTLNNGLPAIATYAPQDAQDRRNYFTEDEDEDDDAESETAEGKTTHGRTRRRNWRFWMRQDIKKAVRLCTSPLLRQNPNYIYYPDSGTIIRLLEGEKGKNFYFDIETDSQLQMTCFGFSLNEGKDIYVVPMLQTHQQPPAYFYTDTHLLLRALAIALRDNTVVIHNAMFDLFVLVWRYGIPVCGRVFDTMLSHNRCYIEVEKSLGHVISFYTDLPYHKNEGVFEPRSTAQARQLYEYNGKDVYALTLLKPAIEIHAARLGATESVEQVNRMVLPYLTMTLKGMRLDTERINAIVDYHTRHNQQVLRILRHCTGQEFNPNSWQQVSRYLYGDEESPGLQIPKPKKDPTNEKTLLELLLKHDVPAIYCILKYRGNQKRISKAAVKSKKKEPRYWWGAQFAAPTTEPRLTCSWRLSGTTTMRLGSSKLLRQWGDNCQNWEKTLRKVVVPD